MEERPVDLHLLHTEIIKAGGPHNIIETYRRPLNECWQIFAAKLGFVQFPGNDRELPMSSPAYGHMLQQVYKAYLFSFDLAYIRICLAKRKGASQVGANSANPAGVQVHGNMGMHPMQGGSSEASSMQTVNTLGRPPVQMIQDVLMITSSQRGREELEKYGQRRQSIAQNLQLAIQRHNQLVNSRQQGNESLYQQHMPRLTTQIGLMQTMITRLDNLRPQLQLRIQQLEQQERLQGDTSTPSVSDASNPDTTLSGLEDELERLNM
ncbi:unnamed protein product [Somion occarium]|uniref:ARID domain-containing protein n=1 Tax=Somion occarium TaxID=3059160 RepID=A0ABP1E978_9APHY